MSRPNSSEGIFTDIRKRIRFDGSITGVTATELGATIIGRNTLVASYFKEVREQEKQSKQIAEEIRHRIQFVQHELGQFSRRSVQRA
jgi:hypothetical protein